MELIEKTADEYAERLLPQVGMRVTDDLRRIIRDAYAAGANDLKGRIEGRCFAIDRDRVFRMYERFLDMEQEYWENKMYVALEHVQERRGTLSDVFGPKIFIDQYHNNRIKEL